MLRVTRLWLVWLALAVGTAFAQAPTVDDVRPTKPPAPSAARGAAYVASVVGVSLISAIGTSWLTTRPQAAIVGDTGRPAPLVTGLGFTASAAMNFGVAHALFPWLAGIGNAPGTTTDFSAAREEAWKLGRWALIPTAASLVVCFVGLGLEHAEFGRGQGVVLVGMSMLLASTLALDVLEALGAWLGANDARQVSAP